MPRKKVVTTREELDGEDATPEIKVTEAPDEGDDELGSLLGVDGLKYRVHKFPTKPGEGGAAFCQDYTKEEFDPAAIRAAFGGGKFRVTVFDEKNRIVNSKQITLAELPRSSQPIAQAPAAAPQSDGMQAMMMEFIKGQAAMVAALLARPQAPVPAGPSLTDLLALIKASESKTDAVDTLLKGLEMGQRLGGGGGDGDSLLGLGKTALETLAPMIRRQAEAPAAPVTARLPHAQNPKPNGAAPVPTVEEKAKMEIVNKLRWVNAMTADMCKRAAAGKSAELYAEVMLDNLPPYITIDEIAERFADPNAVAMLAQINPAVTTHAAWFESFRVAVNSMIEPEEPAPPKPDIEGAG